MRYFLILALLSLPLSTFAYIPKEGNVSAVLGPFFSKTNYEGSSERPATPVLGGMSLGVSGDLNDRGSLEITLTHFNKIFFRDEGSEFLAQQTQMMHITLGYRYWLTTSLSLGVGLFTGYQMGDVKDYDRATAPGSELTTSATDPSEFGFDFSVQGEVWSQDKWSAIVEGRYTRSSTNKNNERGDNYGVLIAARYLIQQGK